MQVLLRNPLGDPYVLGLSGGASSAVLGAMLLGVGTAWLTPAALAGGDAATVAGAGLDANGRGLLINSSRGIIFADDPAAAARALRDEIREAVAARGAA